MTDHFSVIGFRAGSAEDLTRLISRLPEEDGEPLACGPGFYYRWRSVEGPELWIHMLREETPAEEEGAVQEAYRVVGVTPFFSGEGRTPVRVTTIRSRPDDNAFEGAAFVEVAPGEKIHQCATVALIDLVDFACAEGRETPFLASAQITAFPHELAVFPDEAAFEKAQEGETVRFTPRSFFASGLFSPSWEDGGEPVFHDPEGENFAAPARAFFAGRVEKAGARANPVTGQQFHWALLDILGGRIDLVADTMLAKHPFQPGMIVQGEFWLCGRLFLDETEN
jgi:hypothetical protein